MYLSIALLIFLNPGAASAVGHSAGYAKAGHSSNAQSEKERAILEIQQYIVQNDQAAAREALARAIRRYPADGGLENLRGIIEAQSGNYRAAETAFQAAIRLKPGFVNPYLNLGRLYQENAGSDPRALPQALKIYQQLLLHDPANIEARYQTALLLHRTGNAAASLPHLLRLPAQYQDRADVLALYAAAYAAGGDRARSNDAGSRLLRHSDLTAGDVDFAVPLLVGQKRADLAILLLGELARRGTASPASMHQLGLLYEQQGDFEQAREALEKAGPVSAPLLTDLARVAFLQDDFKGALGYLAHARDIEPQNARIHYLFGQTCIRQELVAEANLAFVKAVELEPDNPDYNYAAGAAAAYLRDPADSIPYFRKYLELKPGDAQGRLLLGAVYFRDRNFVAARRELTAALAEKRTAPNARYYLGRIARQEGNLTQAIDELLKALQLEPRNAAALAELGQCYLQRRDYAQAEKALGQALDIDPDNYAANFNLLTLYSRTGDSRQAGQATRFEDVKKRRSEKEQDFLRAIETRPR